MIMEKILGNFLTQANKDFPLDCETLDAIQCNVAMAAMIGNVAGDKIILCGCEEAADGSRGEGYVFVRTKAYPEGEVLRWEGGPSGGGMYLKTEDVGVSVMGCDYPKAYTRRSLAAGVGVENFSWGDFRRPKTAAEVDKEMTDMRERLSRMAPAPLGIVEMWAGETVPAGYALCDGRELRIDEYQELYAAIGSIFNKAIGADGREHATQDGYFRLPDLRGRSVAGRNGDDPDYKSSGMTGGTRQQLLTAENLPAHHHAFKDYMMIPNGNNEVHETSWKFQKGGQEWWHTVGWDNVYGNPRRCDTADGNKQYLQWIEHNTYASGDGVPHENRPPYYVLAYIMRLK